MGKGRREHPPAKKGTRDPLLVELEQGLDQPIPVEQTVPTPDAESKVAVEPTAEPPQMPEPSPKLKAIYGDKEIPSLVAEKFSSVEGTKREERFLMNLKTAEKKETERQAAIAAERKQPINLDLTEPAPTVPEPLAAPEPKQEKKESASEQIAQLRNEVTELEGRVRQGQGDRQTEKEVLDREAKIRELEKGQTYQKVESKKSDRKSEIRARLAELEDKAGQVHGAEHDAVEKEAVALELELQTLDGTHVEQVNVLKAVEDEFVGPPKPEGTRKEWQDKLRGFIMGAKEAVLHPSETLKSASEDLTNRIKELDTKFAENGARWVEKWGDRYNKLPLKYKIAIGLSLTIGLGISMPVSTLGVSAFGGLAMTQRALGLAGTYASFNKKFEAVSKGEAKGGLSGTRLYKWLASGPESSRKDKAMAAAMLQYAVMTGATYGAAYGVGRLWEWMTTHPVGNTGTQTVAEHAPQHAPAANAENPLAGKIIDDVSRHTAGVGEAPAAAVASAGHEIPQIDVAASAGHGYEWMTKRLWEQLQEQHLDASKYAPDSDIHKLLTSTPEDINKVVHELATKHEFFNPSGVSKQIDFSSHLSFNHEGQLSFSDAAHEAYVQAPANLGVTPPFPQPEIHVASAAPVPELPNVEVHSPPVEPVIAPEHPLTTHSSYVEPSAITPQPEHGSLVDSEGHAVTDGSGQPIHTGSYEAPSAPASHIEPPTSHVEIPAFTSFDHAPINPAVPAIYEAQLPQGGTYFAAYGGTDESRFAFVQDFLAKPENHGKIIRFAHEISTVNGPVIRVEEIGAQKTNGILSWLFGSFSAQPAPPSPESFLKRVTN